MEKVFSTCVQQVGWCFGLFDSNVAQTPIDVSGIFFLGEGGCCYG